MTLTEQQTIFHKTASRIENYQDLSKNELAEGYVKAEKENNKYLVDAYFSAIVLRYWFKIFKWMQDSRSTGLRDIDFVDWLVDAIMYGLNHKSWLDPTKAVYNDPNGFDKVINQCCESERLIIYQSLNKDKRKANVYINSLDQQIEENGDAASVYTNAVYNPETGRGAKDLVLTFIKENKLVEAMILDTIARQDSFKEEKEKDYKYELDEETGRTNVTKNYKVTTTFDPRKVVKHLTSIDQNFMTSYFNLEYELDEEKGKEILDKVKGISNSKLYTMIKKTLIEVKDNEEYLSMLI